MKITKTQLREMIREELLTEGSDKTAIKDFHKYIKLAYSAIDKIKLDGPDYKKARSGLSMASNTIINVVKNRK